MLSLTFSSVFHYLSHISYPSHINTYIVCVSWAAFGTAYKWAHMGSCQWVVPVGHATAIIQNAISMFILFFIRYSTILLIHAIV